MSNATSTCTGTTRGNVLIVSILIEQLREAQAAYKLRDDIIALLTEPRPVGIVLDLAKVKFVGSVGFLAFLGVRRQLAGGRIVLCNLSEPVRDMFGVCRLIGSTADTVAPFEAAANVTESLSLLGA